MASTNSGDSLALDKIYTELRTGIRETDNISFRLLGLVPLVSGAVLIGVILKEDTPGQVVTLLSLFAAGITLGIFRWELRNSQTCKWLIRYADCLEQHALNAHAVGAIHQKLETAPQHIGKTQGEMVIYGTTILAWLGLPLSTRAVILPPRVGFDVDVVYSVLAGTILVLTVITLFAKTDVDKACHCEPKRSV